MVHQLTQMEQNLKVMGSQYGYLSQYENPSAAAVGKTASKTRVELNSSLETVAFLDDSLPAFQRSPYEAPEGDNSTTQ
jgi:hypothetical protein